MCEQEILYYDGLIDENNDPVHDPAPLKEYMDKWDGDLFFEDLQLSINKSVLEIGVGTGRIAIRVAPKCKHFVGVDVSPKTIERARKNLTEYKNVELKCDDFMTHKFGCCFDVIYSSLTFMHIKNKRNAFAKVASLLAPHGLFVLSVDKNQNEYIDYGTRKIKIYPDKPEEIRDYIEKAGLILLKQYETEFAYIFVAELSS